MQLLSQSQDFSNNVFSRQCVFRSQSSSFLHALNGKGVSRLGKAALLEQTARSELGILGNVRRRQACSFPGVPNTGKTISHNGYQGVLLLCCSTVCQHILACRSLWNSKHQQHLFAPRLLHLQYHRPQNLT